MSLNKKPVIQHSGGQHLIYDATLSESILPQWLDSEYWQKQDNLQATTLGRGRAWFISAADNEYVLRHYCRGGAMARLSHDRYAWLGLEQTRAWREWYLLAWMQKHALPSPVPVAARVTRKGLFYTADILTVKIQDTATLSECLGLRDIGKGLWQQIGGTIRRFHEKNIYHADLNAHNILVSGANTIHLIDFDKGRINPCTSWQPANLKRLHGSLNKLKRQCSEFYFNERDWNQLIKGYRGI